LVNAESRAEVSILVKIRENFIIANTELALAA